jgi:predicted DNA binding CopG/RHH family protein
MKKKIPEFDNEDQEREFWASHDSTEYVDWKKANRVKFPKLKPSTRTISIRLPESMLDDLKKLANKNDVPYQSLLKIYLAERIREELGLSAARQT